jgi:hypothetical protein
LVFGEAFIEFGAAAEEVFGGFYVFVVYAVGELGPDGWAGGMDAGCGRFLMSCVMLSSAGRLE